MPRIITGKAKGTRLLVPAGTFLRPTSGRTKEALFSILDLKVEGARLLDLFSGSGQMALEALSRGASEAVLIEGNKKAQAAIRTNLERTRLTGARLLFGDYRTGLETLISEERTFDLIYVDPPWAEAGRILPRLAEKLPPLLDPSGLLILESEGPPPPFFEGPLDLLRSCQYGTGVLSFYQFKPDSREFSASTKQGDRDADK